MQAIYADGVTCDVTERVALPVCDGSGVTVSVRAEPEPPSTIPVDGTRVGADETAATTSALGAVSASPTVKPMVPVDAPLFTTRSEMEVMVGA